MRRLARAFAIRAWPWFALAAVLLIVAVAVLHGTASAVDAAAALFVFLAACLRALVLQLRDDPGGATSIRGPAGRTLGLLGADAAARRRGRRARKPRR
jgi:hypothetical protein